MLGQPHTRSIKARLFSSVNCHPIEVSLASIFSSCLSDRNVWGIVQANDNLLVLLGHLSIFRVVYKFIILYARRRFNW